MMVQKPTKGYRASGSNGRLEDVGSREVRVGHSLWLMFEHRPKEIRVMLSRSGVSRDRLGGPSKDLQPQQS